MHVQYEEHALHTDATEFSNSSLYSTADMRYASLPSPHIHGPPVFSNQKNTHDHCYHTIPINVHYFLIVNKHIYFKKSSILFIFHKILANIIHLPFLKEKIKIKSLDKKRTLWSMESIERSMIRYPFIFQIDSAVFSFFPQTGMPQDPTPGDRNPNGSHRPKVMTNTCNPLFGHNLLSCTKYGLKWQYNLNSGIFSF